METKKESAKTTPKDIQRLTVSKNGPYLVSGRIPVLKQTILADSEGTALEWRKDVEYQLQEKCGLCRCGNSKNKPFCDGTHLKISFDGTETAGDEDYIEAHKDIQGPALTLIDIEELCASARFCHRAGGIWNLINESDNPQSKRIIVEEACDCPSGRLVVRDKKNGELLEAKFEKSIVAIEDPTVGVSGPLWVRACIPIESADGKTYRIRNRVTLCRCGKSSNKPFCDSSHYPEEHEHGEV